jgi:hypothetical protein
MAFIHERSVWSSGTSAEHSGRIHKSMTTTKRAFCQEMFPKIQKDGENQEETAQETKEEAEPIAPSPEKSDKVVGKPSLLTVDALKGRAAEEMERALAGCGYEKDLLSDERFRSTLAKALLEKGEIVSQRTKKLWVERELPEEPPASIFPDKLKLGDRAQVLNWVPMGVHGAKIDLFPRGKVSKIYKVKCLVTKEPIPFGEIPGADAEFSEEERVIGLELDGKGPYTLNKESSRATYPYIIKDSSIIIRFPAMADPSGQTDHVSPGLV